MVIRQMGSLDLRATNRLLAECIALQQPRGEKPQSGEAIYRRLRDRSLPTTYEGKLRYLVAEIGRKVVGLCVFYTYSDGFVGYADVRDLYVSPPHQRRGIGAPCRKRPRRRPPKTAARLGIRFYPDPYIGYLLLYSLPLLVLDCLQLVLAVVGVSLVFMAVDWSRTRDSLESL